MSAHPTPGVAADLRNISAVLREMKDEAAQFARTRMALLKAELEEKLPSLKSAAVFAVLAALLLGTAYLLLTGAVVVAAAILFKDSDYRWVFAFLSVGILWSLIGGIAFFLAKRKFAAKGLVPRRTVAVLKGDKIWLETEANNQI